jgi:hypothetical protein
MLRKPFIFGNIIVLSRGITQQQEGIAIEAKKFLKSLESIVNIGLTLKRLERKCPSLLEGKLFLKQLKKNTDRML